MNLNGLKERVKRGEVPPADAFKLLNNKLYDLGEEDTPDSANAFSQGTHKLRVWLEKRATVPAPTQPTPPTKPACRRKPTTPLKPVPTEHSILSPSSGE